jgi:phosphoglucomutase
MTAQDCYRQWLDSPALNEGEKAELLSIAGDPAEIEERFFSPLKFGTGGLRGYMAAGLHRMNRHTVRHMTQAMAEPLLKGDCGTVAVCYDTRNNSEAFAREAACVLAANGIHVRLFENPRPTPMLSFAILHYGCAAGINITASHNPKEYNGYKIYWSDGVQILPGLAGDLEREREKISIFEGIRIISMDEARKKGLLTMMGKETDDAYLGAVSGQSLADENTRKAAKNMKIVYTPFHGCGSEPVPRILLRSGFENILFVEEQMTPDGNFPTVKSPNPEDKEGFALAVEMAEREGADLIIGTDPDADRVGVAERNACPHGEFTFFSGNQIGVILLDYIINSRNKNGTLPKSPAFVKTIVTTPMAAAIAEDAGIPCYDTFTGFKFIAEKIIQLEAEGKQTIFAFEESIGYLAGNHARDKDAVVASMLIAEMAAYYSSKGMSLLNALDSLYAKHGFYAETTVSLDMPGKNGMEKMRQLMKKLRKEPLTEIAGVKVTGLRDYLTDKRPPSGSDLLCYELEDGTLYLIRPSGTEPKLKIYIMAKSKSKEDCKLEKYRAFSHSNLG